MKVWEMGLEREKRGEGEKREGGFIEREGVDMMINRGEGIYSSADYY